MSASVAHVRASETSTIRLRLSNNGSLTITTVDGLTGVNATGGGVYLTTSGAFTVAATIVSPSGPINLTAAGDDNLLTVNALIQTASGNGTFTADKMAILHTVNFGFGTLTLVPESMADSDAILLGSGTDNTANTLELSSAEINTLFVGTVQIGDSASGPITIGSDVAAGFGTHLSLTSGQGISITSGTISTSGGGNLTLAPGSASAVGVAKTGTDANLSTSGTLSFASGSDLAIVINGKTVDSQYQQLNVTGKVNLTGVDLALSGTYTPVIGDKFTIVANDGADAVTGTFNGLPEGKVFSVSAGALTGSFQITYRGENGNDVVLTAIDAASPALQGTPGDDNWLVKRSGNDLNVTLNGNLIWSPLFSTLTSLTINGLAGADVLTVDSSAGDPFPSGGITFHGGGQSGDKLITTGVPGGGSYSAASSDYSFVGSGILRFFGNQTDVLIYDGLSSSIDITGSTATNLIFGLPSTPSLAVLEDEGTVGNNIAQLRSGNGAFLTTLFTNPSGGASFIPISSSETFTVNSLPSSDFSGGLTLGSSGNPFVSVTFAGGLTLAANRSISANASGTISLPNASSDLALSASGAVTLTTAQNISLSSGSSITSVNGTITLSANQQATPTSGNFIGIDVNGATVQATGAGAVTVKGKGGNDSTGSQYGVRVLSSGKISGGTAGLLTVQGTGGASSGNTNRGVYVAQPSLITSSGGGVVLTGQGGGSGASGFNDGVYLTSSAQVTAGGTGTVTVQGIGGADSGDSNNGVYVASSAVITSGGGNVQVTGQGGGAGAAGSNAGVSISSSGQVSAGGSGTVTLQGTGGNGSGNSNNGVYVSSGAVITSSGGSVQIIGIEGATSPGINVSNGTASTATSGGTLTLVGNSMSFGLAATISASVTSSVTLRPSGSGIGINLGLATDPIGGPLGLTDAELDRITSGTIQVGSTTTGPITISGAISRSSATVMNLASGGAINFTTGSLNTLGGNLTLSPGAAASVGVANTGNDVTTGAASTLNFASNSDLTIAINGTTVDSQYQQLNVVGKVDLTGVDLVLSGIYTPVIGNSFILVNNDGSDAVVGEFNGLPEGKVFNPAAGALNADFRITYHGGDGNDVVLTATNVAPTLAAIPDPDPIAEDADLQTINLSGITAGGTQSQSLSVTATSDNPGLIPNPDVVYTSPGATGSLSYKPVANQSGTAVITVTVKDNGGTASGSDAFTRTFTVKITEVNDAPSGVNDTLANVNEDSGVRTIAFDALLANDSKGPANESSQTLSIIDVSGAVGGTVQIVGTDVIFTPATDFNGPASFTYTLQDNGQTNGADDFKTSTAVASFTIDAVNDAPSFIKGANQSVTFGLHSVPGWATAIVAGPPTATDETGQQLSFNVDNDNNDLFAVQPTIDPSGKLTFAAQFNVAGTAHVTVVLMDNGGTAHGGVDKSTEQTFNIVVTKPHVWHNDANPLDVTGEGDQPDGHVVAADALAIINFINGFGSGAVPANAQIGQPYGFLDTAGGINDVGDDFIAPNDALAVIDAINAGLGGEGESVARASVSSPLPTNDLLSLLALDVASQPKRRR
jgi:hypothetical protein